VVACSLETPGIQPSMVLYACLQVVDNIRFQGRISEGLNLHRGLHQKILNLLGPENELAILSKDTLAIFQSDFGEHSSAVAIYREVLQICLLQYGARDTLTLESLLWLGWALNSCGQYRGAETILCIRVELGGEISGYVDNDIAVVEDVVISMSSLAWSLNAQRRYEDSANVLDMTERRFKHLMRFETHFCWIYYEEKAELLKAKGYIFGSEAILRAVLSYAPDHPDWDILEAMEMLVDILTRTNRTMEATIWMEKLFLMGIDMYGIEHRYSKGDCEELGFCYAELGRYEDAIVHFQQTAEKVAISQTGDPKSRNEYIKEIRGWISKVEKMKEGGGRGFEDPTISLDYTSSLDRYCSLSLFAINFLIVDRCPITGNFELTPPNLEAHQVGSHTLVLPCLDPFSN
jgi:tetratricopeptide (TPR) repeat protein